MKINLHFRQTPKSVHKKECNFTAPRKALAGIAGGMLLLNSGFFELWHSHLLSIADMCMLCDRQSGPEWKSGAWVGYNSK